MTHLWGTNCGTVTLDKISWISLQFHWPILIRLLNADQKWSAKLCKPLTCKSLRRFFCFRSSNLDGSNLPTIEAEQDHTRQDKSVWYAYTMFINFIQFVKSLTNQGDFHASEWFLSSSVLSSHLSASDLPGSCWFHLGWYCRHWWMLIVQDRLPY